MTPAQGVSHARQEQAWQLRAVAGAMKLGGCDVVVAADDADGPVRIRHAATGLRYEHALTAEERTEARRRLAHALVSAMVTRKVG